MDPKRQMLAKECILPEKTTAKSKCDSHFSPLAPQPSSDTASCSTSGLTGGPIISDVTDMSQASMALQMQPDETR